MDRRTVRSDTKDNYSFSPEDLSYIIRARLEEILRMILLEIPHSEYAPHSGALAGGSANLSGMEELARKVMGLPVHIAKPKGIADGDDGLHDPSYTACAGLLLWGAGHGDEEVDSLN